MTVAFVFPGQGSQYVGMMQKYASEPIIKNTFALAAEVLGFDLWAMCCPNPSTDPSTAPSTDPTTEDASSTNANKEEELNNTINTQPALLTAGVALWQLWRDKGGHLPSYMAGHSLGEYTALVCADALDFPAALNLVRNRGKYMKMSMGENKGAMAAILGLDEAKVAEICSEASSTSYVFPANINSPKQVVISGYAIGVEKAMAKAKKAGAKRAVLLPVTVPSHCALMQPAADLLVGDLETTNINMPKIPVLHNIDASVSTSPDEIKIKLIRQLVKSVQWIDTIKTMQKSGVKSLVECGPKKVLTSLNKSIAPDINLYEIGEDPDRFTLALNELSK